MRRPLILIGALAFIVGLAFLVARPSREPAATTPYLGDRGASRVKASGLGIALVRAGETKPLAPGTPLAAGDRLRLTVRAEHARHLLVRMRDGDGAAMTVFPAKDAHASASVAPGDALPAPPVITAGTGKVIVTAIFADHPFTLEDARKDVGTDVETIDLVMEKE
ncbi:MAG: hypothetical protein JWM82_3766 [Myxococcales bacterium]|nr:hypothetical protein [Myxococcales bacterium]